MIREKMLNQHAIWWDLGLDIVQVSTSLMNEGVKWDLRLKYEEGRFGALEQSLRKNITVIRRLCKDFDVILQLLKK